MSEMSKTESLRRKPGSRICSPMNAVEFTAELSGAAVLPIPEEIAARLPRTGKARIIVLTDSGSEDADWFAGAYEQYLRDDSPEDAIYDNGART